VISVFKFYKYVHTLNCTATLITIMISISDHLSLILVWLISFLFLQGEENCQPVCNSFRSFHSSFTTCVPKGTRVGSKVATQVTHHLSPRVEALLSRRQLKSMSGMGLGLQIKTERIGSLDSERIRFTQSLLADNSTQLLRRSEIAQKSPVSFIERECRCGHFLPQPIQAVPHSEFLNYDNTIPLISWDPSQNEGSVSLLYADFKFLTALCCIIYLFRIVYILQIVTVAVISLFCSWIAICSLKSELLIFVMLTWTYLLNIVMHVFSYKHQNFNLKQGFILFYLKECLKF